MRQAAVVMHCNLVRSYIEIFVSGWLRTFSEMYFGCPQPCHQ